MKIISINPSDKSEIGSVNSSSSEEVIAKVEMARKALKSWKEIGVQGRIEHCRKIVSILERRADEFSKLISKEMGMPISQSHHDVSGSIDYFNWYIDSAEKYLSEEITFEDETIIHKVFHEPVGVLAVITPWNFPTSNFIWMSAQALLAGNTVVFKDSEEVPFCGRFIEEVMIEAGLPEGVFSEVYGKGDIGDLLVHQDIDMICFTGSTKTGEYLYTVAAKNFKKVLLELGGSAPGIVFQDADLDVSLDTIYANRFDNCGQICDGLKRLIVHKSIFEDVTNRLSEMLDNKVIGDALEPKTDIGPLVSQKQWEILKEQVDDAISKGAKVIYKREIDNKLNGFFFSPMILTNINPKMRVWNEEVFGPVLIVVPFEEDSEAISLANDTKYGLGGFVFTQDKEKFLSVASQIQSGMIQHNDASYINPASPFGGYKRSGLGREHGRFGFSDVTQVKLVSCVK